MKRSSYPKRYLLSAFITLLIFFLGISLGIIIDNMRVSYVENLNAQQEINFEDLQLQSSYINTLKSENSSDVCSAYQAVIERAVGDLSDSLAEVEDYSQNNRINKEDYDRIQKKYILDNIRYWFLVKTAKKQCRLNTTTILYFYDSKCTICPNQGVILSYFKKIYGNNLLVFPINMDYGKDLSIVKAIKNQFNVTSYPSIIVNGVTYKGVVSKEELAGILKKDFQEANSLNGKDEK